MKLNSKLPFIVISCTITIFLGFSISNDNNEPRLETIRGHISELEDININIREEESSLYNSFIHTINNGNEVSTIKEKKIDVSFEELKYIELLDISCGQDYILYVGYENDYSEDTNQISLIVDERKNNKGNQILENQGKDELIINTDVNLNGINRTKIKLEYPSISPGIELAYILGSYRYKGDLYLISNYTSKYHDYVYGKNYLVISKLDKESKELQEVSSIDLKDKVSMNEYLSVVEIINQNEKIYSLIVSENNDQNNDFYLIEYDLLTKESTVNKIDADKSYHFLGAYEDNNKLNLILGNTRKNVELLCIEYDIASKKMIDESKLVVEPRDAKSENRYVSNTVVKQDKIYITVGDNSSYGTYQKNMKIYAIDKGNMYITYEGKILRSEFVEIE